MGYATQTGGLPPPLGYAKAGPGADKDIDYETYYGPGKVPTASGEPSASWRKAEAATCGPASRREALAAARPSQPMSKAIAAAAKPVKARLPRAESRSRRSPCSR